MGWNNCVSGRVPEGRSIKVEEEREGDSFKRSTSTGK